MGCIQSTPEAPAQSGPNTLSSLRSQPIHLVDNGAGVSTVRRPLPTIPTKQEAFIAIGSTSPIIEPKSSSNTTANPTSPIIESNPTSLLIGLDIPNVTDNILPIDQNFSPTSEQIVKVSKFTYRRGNNFAWKGVYLAKFVKSYDGDTGTFILENEVQLSLRLARIDTPEINTNTMPQEWKRSDRLIEKEEAEASLNKLIELIGPSKVVIVNLQGTDKYGRTLAELYSINNNKLGESINQQMLDLHYALPYDGGKKQIKVGYTLRQLRN